MLATNVRAKKLARIRKEKLEKVGAIFTGVFMFVVFYLLTFL